MRGATHVRAALALLCAATLTARPLAPTSAHAALPQRAHGATACATPGTFPYLHTCGPYLEDFLGRPVRLLAVNWYGFESNDFVAAGLDRRSYRDIVDMIKALGYNALRLPFSNEMVEKNPVVSALTRTCPQGAPATACRSIDGQSLLAANPDLQGLTSLQILKAIVDYAGAQGLYVFLDDHRSRAGWGSQEDGVWYDNAYGYPQASWLGDWEHLALLFANDAALTGVDLFNEPHSLGAPTTCAAYLTEHGASWGACNGQSNPTTDWRAAAMQAGNSLLAINPHLLIVVEGTSVVPTAAGTFDTAGGGGNLEAAGSQPIHLAVPGRLVYSVHAYYWTQDITDAATMAARWSRLFGYLTNPAAPDAAPVWVGELGTCNDDPTCVYDTTPGSFGYWFDTLLRYLNTPPYADAPPFGWGYWALNGTSSDAYNFVAGHWAHHSGDLEPYGLLNTAWSDQSLPALQGELFSGAQLDVTPAPAGTAPTTPTAVVTSTPAGAPTPAPTGTGAIQPMASLLSAPALRISVRGVLDRGQVSFDLWVHRDRDARLWGDFPYDDRLHHVVLQALQIDGVNLYCVPAPRVEVTGTARDRRDHRYRFAVWVGDARGGRIAFTLRLSNGYLLSGVARGRAAFPC